MFTETIEEEVGSYHFFLMTGKRTFPPNSVAVEGRGCHIDCGVVVVSTKEYFSVIHGWSHMIKQAKNDPYKSKS